MKVLFIISTLQAGGAERVMSLLASYFAKFHDVTLLKFDTKPPFYELDDKAREKVFLSAKFDQKRRI